MPFNSLIYNTPSSVDYAASMNAPQPFDRPEGVFNNALDETNTQASTPDPQKRISRGYNPQYAAASDMVLGVAGALSNMHGNTKEAAVERFNRERSGMDNVGLTNYTTLEDRRGSTGYYQRGGSHSNGRPLVRQQGFSYGFPIPYGDNSGRNFNNVGLGTGKLGKYNLAASGLFNRFGAQPTDVSATYPINENITLNSKIGLNDHYNRRGNRGPNMDRRFNIGANIRFQEGGVYSLLAEDAMESGDQETAALFNSMSQEEQHEAQRAQMAQSMMEAYKANQVESTAGPQVRQTNQIPLPDFTMLNSRQRRGVEPMPTNATPKGNFRETIASIESQGSGDYQAVNTNSSAAGRYQFLWGTHGKDIKRITGTGTKKAFLNNPEAQEKYMDHWENKVLTPQARRLKKYAPNMSESQLKALVHFKGPGGAKEYLTKGRDRTTAHNTSIPSYINQFRKGGMTNTTGYTPGTESFNNPYNIIPSGDITMKNTPFPVYGIDNTGHQQMMMPGGTYRFPGNSVLELPAFKRGGMTDEESKVKYKNPRYVQSAIEDTSEIDAMKERFDKVVYADNTEPTTVTTEPTIITTEPTRTKTEPNFKESFRQARKAGKEAFRWRGKLYNTELKKNKVPTQRQASAPQRQTAQRQTTQSKPKARVTYEKEQPKESYFNRMRRMSAGIKVPEEQPKESYFNKMRRMSAGAQPKEQPKESYLSKMRRMSAGIKVPEEQPKESYFNKMRRMSAGIEVPKRDTLPQSRVSFTPQKGNIKKSTNKRPSAYDIVDHDGRTQHGMDHIVYEETPNSFRKSYMREANDDKDSPSNYDRLDARISPTEMVTSIVDYDTGDTTSYYNPTTPWLSPNKKSYLDVIDRFGNISQFRDSQDLEVRKGNVTNPVVYPWIGNAANRLYTPTHTYLPPSKSKLKKKPAPQESYLNKMRRMSAGVEVPKEQPKESYLNRMRRMSAGVEVPKEQPKESYLNRMRRMSAGVEVPKEQPKESYLNRMRRMSAGVELPKERNYNEEEQPKESYLNKMRRMSAGIEVPKERNYNKEEGISENTFKDDVIQGVNLTRNRLKEWWSPSKTAPVKLDKATTTDKGLEIDYGYKNLGNVEDWNYHTNSSYNYKGGKDSLHSFINTFDNESGGDYKVSSNMINYTGKGKKHKTFDNVEGVAHFIMDRDFTDNQDPKYTYRGAGDARKIKSIEPGKRFLGSNVSKSPNAWIMYNKPLGGDNYKIKYGRGSDAETLKKDGWRPDVSMRVLNFADLDMRPSSGEKKYAHTTSFLKDTVNNRSTSLPSAPTNNDAYGRFAGGSGVFMLNINGKSVGVDAAGSPKQLKQVHSQLAKKYNLDPKDIPFLYSDMGSYSGKPKSKNGKLNTRQWRNFNRNSKGYAGSALMIPKK